MEPGLAEPPSRGKLGASWRDSRAMVVCAVAATWLGLAVTGLGWLGTYKQAPAETRRPPQLTPAELQRLGGDAPWTVVMAIHPRCPCTRASLEAVARLLANRSGRVSATFLLVNPAEAPTNFANTAIVEAAKKIPGTKLVVDDGSLATKLGMEVSGSAVCFDAAGVPRFWGGLTPSRGHAGDCRGLDALAVLCDGLALDHTATSTAFGCRLLAERRDDATHSVEPIRLRSVP